MKSAPQSIRSFLIAEAMQFIAAAQKFPGVRRIAIIGSLTTAKKNPKDVDVLIWIDDGADLTALATAARRLKGRAQSRNKGADIFLAGPDNTYLGRICHHRECRAGNASARQITVHAGRISATTSRCSSCLRK